MRKLPVSERGYPVPWFVEWVDPETRKPVPVGEGEPDFRIMSATSFQKAVRERRCWVCGGKLGRYLAFVAGPMCGINRTSSEPPSHRDCAVFSARACPFLARPHARRRPMDDEDSQMSGQGLLRNPQVAMVWVTRDYSLFDDGGGGLLVQMGDPVEVQWYREGDEASREDVLESIESGLPSLIELCESEEEVARVKELRDEFIAERVPE